MRVSIDLTVKPNCGFTLTVHLNLNATEPKLGSILANKIDYDFKLLIALNC